MRCAVLHHKPKTCPLELVCSPLNCSEGHSPSKRPVASAVAIVLFHDRHIVLKSVLLQDIFHIVSTELNIVRILYKADGSGFLLTIQDKFR